METGSNPCNSAQAGEPPCQGPRGCVLHPAPPVGVGSSIQVGRTGMVRDRHQLSRPMIHARQGRSQSKKNQVARSWRSPSGSAPRRSRIWVAVAPAVQARDQQRAGRRSPISAPWSAGGSGDQACTARKYARLHPARRHSRRFGVSCERQHPAEIRACCSFELRNCLSTYGLGQGPSFRRRG